MIFKEQINIDVTTCYFSDTAVANKNYLLTSLVGRIMLMWFEL